MTVIIWYTQKSQTKHFILGRILICIWLFIISVSCSQESSSRSVHLIKGLDVLTVEDSPVVDDLFENKCKVVAYFKIYNFEKWVLGYAEYIKKYPNVSFIFYLGGEGEDEMLELMKKTDFKHPVYLDREKSFIKANNIPSMDGHDLSFKGYVIGEDFIEVSHPGQQPEFETLLRRCPD